MTGAEQRVVSRVLVNLDSLPYRVKVDGHPVRDALDATVADHSVTVEWIDGRTVQYLAHHVGRLDETTWGEAPMRLVEPDPHHGGEQGFLRRKDAKHTCDTPDHARRGDVWRCRCGKRYTCVDHRTRSGNRVTMRADWRPRLWPWPR